MADTEQRRRLLIPLLPIAGVISSTGSRVVATNRDASPRRGTLQQPDRKKARPHGPGKGLNSMISIRKREDSRNCFPERAEQNHRRTEHVAVVRRVGPRWVTAGRRPRAIPVLAR
jgi:hypothetical protein